MGDIQVSQFRIWSAQVTYLFETTRHFLFVFQQVSMGWQLLQSKDEQIYEGRIHQIFYQFLITTIYKFTVVIMKEENDLINKPDALSSMMIGKQLLKTFQNLAPSWWHSWSYHHPSSITSNCPGIQRRILVWGTNPGTMKFKTDTEPPICRKMVPTLLNLVPDKSHGTQLCARNEIYSEGL